VVALVWVISKNVNQLHFSNKMEQRRFLLVAQYHFEEMLMFRWGLGRVHHLGRGYILIDDDGISLVL
jgi:hypothetical protein